MNSYLIPLNFICIFCEIFVRIRKYNAFYSKFFNIWEKLLIFSVEYEIIIKCE